MDDSAMDALFDKDERQSRYDALDALGWNIGDIASAAGLKVQTAQAIVDRGSTVGKVGVLDKWMLDNEGVTPTEYKARNRSVAKETPALYPAITPDPFQDMADYVEKLVRFMRSDIWSPEVKTEQFCSFIQTTFGTLDSIRESMKSHSERNLESSNILIGKEGHD